MTTFINGPQIALADSVMPYNLGPIAGAAGYSPSDYLFGGPRVVRSRMADSGQLGIPATMATTQVVRLMRVPDNIIVQKLEAFVDIPTGTTLTTATFNFGIAYSDRPGDVPPSLANYGVGTGVISDSFFAYHVDLHAATTPTDITLNNATGNSVTDGYYTAGALEYELWDAIQNGGSDRTLVTVSSALTTFYSQGKGYSSGTTAPWTASYNSGTILPPYGASSAGQASSLYPFGDPGCLVDIVARPSTTVSSTGPVTLFIRLTYLSPEAP